MGVSQWVMVAKSGMIGFYQIMADLANWRGDSTPPLAAHDCEIPAFAGMVCGGTGVCVWILAFVPLQTILRWIRTDSCN